MVTASSGEYLSNMLGNYCTLAAQKSENYSSFHIEPEKPQLRCLNKTSCSFQIEISTGKALNFRAETLTEGYC